jgi:hypothetical protein
VEADVKRKKAVKKNPPPCIARRHLIEIRRDLIERFDTLERRIALLNERTLQIDNAMDQLKQTPLSVVREIEDMLKKLDDFYTDKSATVDRIMPNIADQFNAMAEAVNKISAYARAIEESGKPLKQLTIERIRNLEKRGEFHTGRIMKLHHRLKRMEQKL